MNIIFLINSIISLAVALMLFIKFFKNYNKEMHKIIRYFSFIGVLYFFVSVFSFLWFLNVLNYSSQDFLFIYSLVILIQSIFLFMVIYSFSKNKKMFYFLFFYFIIFLSFFSSAFNFLYLFLITSFLLTLLFFLDLSLRYGECRIPSYFGIFYSVISLLFSLLLLFQIGGIFIFSLFSNLVFFIFILIFLKNVKKYPCVDSKRIKECKQQHYILVFLRYFVFILVLTNFVFIATISIHEFGHLTVSKFYDCEYGRIVYENSSARTEILCKDLSGNIFVLFGGVLLPFLIAAALFIIGGKFIKDISLLMIGFNFIACNKDLLDLGFSENIIMLSLIAGVLCLISGIVMLIRSRLEDSFYAF
jgi:hypothetical protein